MCVLAGPLIRVLYKGGKFTETDAVTAAAALLAYSAATFAWSASAILARGFYALQDTKTPVFITTPMVGLFVLACALYARWEPRGYLGFALATSAIGILSTLLFLALLQKRAGGLNLRAILSSTARVVLASAAAGGAAHLLASLLDARLGLSPLAALVTLVAAGGGGIIVYVLACRLLRVPELHGIRDMFRRQKAGPPSAAVPSGEA
jgi:putative peptidoglycan lipid II flippase